MPGPIPKTLTLQPSQLAGTIFASTLFSPHVCCESVSLPITLEDTSSDRPVGQAYAGDCDAAIRFAYNKINGRDLFNDIASALHQMIDKSGRDDFKVYQTGYRGFFNQDTDICDYTTFYYWQPGHHAFHRIGNWAYLEKPLRLKLNNLVAELNTMLRQVVDLVNRSYQGSSGQREWFIDPNPVFDGHRFCEADVIEPDSSRMDNYLFLSGWSDNTLPSTVAETTQAAIAEEAALLAGNQTALDLNTCNFLASGDNNWYRHMLCDAAQAVLSPAPANYVGPNNASQAVVDDNEVSGLEFGWYVLTRTAKTLHPRTLGHTAYKNLTMDAW